MDNKSFMKETKSELKKVIWPTKQEVINGTATVIAMVAIVGIIIFAFDTASAWVVKKVIQSDFGVVEQLPEEITEDINLGDEVVEDEQGEVSESAETTETTEATENDGTAES